MAIHTLLYVLNHSKAKKSHRLVLIEIANHTNKEGLAWPSYQTIANKTGLTRRRVIDLVADLAAVGELEVLPEGSPFGGQAYRILAGEIVSPDDSIPGEIFDTELVKPFHPNLLIESLYPNNETEDQNRWLTPYEAVRLGLTPGSRLYQNATGKALPGG